MTKRKHCETGLNCYEKEVFARDLFLDHFEDEDFKRDYIIERNVDGCQADIRFKKKDSQLWLGIQLKSCYNLKFRYDKRYNNYTKVRRFSTLTKRKEKISKYRNIPVALISYAENRYWCLNGSNINTEGIDIHDNSPKYNKFEVKSGNLINYFKNNIRFKFFNDLILCRLKYLHEINKILDTNITT